MNIVLATGIYPPEIGGPATYVRALAKELVQKGHVVTVIAYGTPKRGEGFDVYGVSRSFPVFRWVLYAMMLRRHARDADVVVAFSSVSVGIPCVLAFSKKPKYILRLGGDFLWERYADWGGRLGLRNWYESNRYWVFGIWYGVLLQFFDHVVFSTRFQEEVYEKHYKKLPPHSVIENAVPSGTPILHEKHTLFRLLFMGRFVGFKNLPALIEAVGMLEGVSVTLVGEGPMEDTLRRMVGARHLSDEALVKADAVPLQGRVVHLHPAHGQDILKIFSEHDLLVIPSITEISPNVALEARAAGLPVLLTKETGLSQALRQGMVVRNLSTPMRIAEAVREVMDDYERIAEEAAKAPTARGWRSVAEEWMDLCTML
jgi:glycosyltransferase involved in cell wall biosynthesis